MTAKTLGILGGGQLARMLAEAALRLGIRPVVYDPDPDCPASALAERFPGESWQDNDALSHFARRCDAVTLEFENVPMDAAEVISQHCPLRPGAGILAICQNRLKERTFLLNGGYPQPDWVFWPAGDPPPPHSLKQGVVKTTQGGYDGKGQWRFGRDAPFPPRELPHDRDLIIEAWLEDIREFSVLVARNPQGDCAAFPPIENLHRNHILDESRVPADLPERAAREAEQLALLIAETIGLEGLLAVELFLDASGNWRVNELAPRPHNSGHLTLQAATLSQFEQAIRAVFGWPLGKPDWTSPALMWNLLGDLWDPLEPDWKDALRLPSTHLHLYGKRVARPGRKMGHITFTGDDLTILKTRQKSLRSRWMNLP